MERERETFTQITSLVVERIEPETQFTTVLVSWRVSSKETKDLRTHSNRGLYMPGKRGEWGQATLETSAGGNPGRSPRNRISDFSPMPCEVNRRAGFQHLFLSDNE